MTRRSLILIASVAACSSYQGGSSGPATTRVADAPAPSASDLSGTAWRLVDQAGAAVPDGMEATLEFPEAGRVAGRAFCNRFLGSVTTSGSSISFGQLGATRMACADAVNEQQTNYLTALQAAEHFGREGDALLIYLRGNDQPLRFVRIKR